jgi:hypothetical protein
MNIILRHRDSLRLIKIRFLHIKLLQRSILFLCLVLINSCVSEFIPRITEEKELLVVEGLITDQPEPCIIKISKSMPLEEAGAATPIGGCTVTVSDDLGNIYSFSEAGEGTYSSSTGNFQGVIGRSYTLHIMTNSSNKNLTYVSDPMELKKVPPIDSIYYEKTIIEKSQENFPGIDGCQILLNTHDPENNCKFYRWDYSETWEFRILFPVPNNICWISDNSNNIIIKSTAVLGKDRIIRYPINYISNATDRLKKRYSILVNQYSLNEAEYNYWEQLQNLTVQVGGLYDLIPASVPNNLRCIENPEEKVLGYFSVSAKSSKRIFIENNFSGIIDPYANCISDTLHTDYIAGIAGLNTTVWILLLHKGSFSSPGYTIITRSRGCADCTVRGTNIEPDFWKVGK